MGYGPVLRLDLALLVRRRLPRWAAGVALATVLSSALWSQAGDGQGHALLASATRLLVAVMIGLTSVLAAVMISGDAASGALRGVLVRPVSRSGVVLAHATALSLFTVLVYAVCTLAAVLVAELCCGFADVTRHQYVVMPQEEMARFAVRLVLCPLPALLVPPVLALCVSAVTDDAAIAVLLSLAATLGPLLFGLIGGDVPEWAFTERAMHPVTVLGELAEGIQLEADRVAGDGYVAGALWQPALWIAALLGLSLLLFRTREIRA